MPESDEKPGAAKVDGGEKETGERLEYYRMNYSVQYPSTTTVESSRAG